MNSRITRSTACYSGKPWSPLDRPEMFRPGSLNILAVCGPTAVGKTKFAIECARAFHGEIVSCDSMQLYKYMDIGSAKPTEEEQSRAKHWLVDLIDPKEDFSVARYQHLAKEAIRDIAGRGLLPVIAGGTGLYLNSLLYDMDFSRPPEDPSFRQRLYELADREGNAAVYELLRRKDPEAAGRIHPNNRKKVIRALEAAEAGGHIRDISRELRPVEEYGRILIGLARNREELYDRIGRRVDLLMEEGLVEEVRGLLEQGLTADDISMKGIGYKEIISFLNGECTKEDAVRLVKQNTRHLAKRQMTWLRRFPDMIWFNISEYDSDEDCIRAILNRVGAILTGNHD